MNKYILISITDKPKLILDAYGGETLSRLVVGHLIEKYGEMAHMDVMRLCRCERSETAELVVEILRAVGLQWDIKYTLFSKEDEGEWREVEVF
jgi:hypothetical protein